MDWSWADFTYQTSMMVFAFLQSAVIGIERQARHKSAGFRTHILVGVASCLFTLVSFYGFDFNPSPRWDGSRIAAQVVSGIGFLGAGVIFLNRDVIRGLTTAASVWLVSAVGMSCGIGFPHLGLVALALHLVAVVLAPVVSRYLANMGTNPFLHVQYVSGNGVLRQILEILEQRNVRYRVKSTCKDDKKSIVDLIISIDALHISSRTIFELSELTGVLVVETESEMDD